MKSHLFVRGLAATVVAAGVCMSGATAARAATPTAPSPSATPAGTGQALAALKQKCDDAIHQRLGTLGADAQFVATAPFVTSANRTTLEAQITSDKSGLTALDATIQADTTLTQAHTDCATIVTGFRVYVMEDPKIHEVIAADGVSAANASFESLIPQLQELINGSTAPDKAAAQTALNDLRSKVTASETSVSGVVNSVINLTPAGYPGNDVQLKSAQSNIKTAKGDLDGARGDVNQVLKDLGH